MPFLTIAGFALGALAGWLLAGWALRRRRSQALWLQVAASSAFVLGTLALLPSTLFSLIAMVSSMWTVQPTPVWIGYMFIFVRGSALLGAVLLLVALALTALPAAGQQPNRREA